uniref:G_PROTEIN_RECEP_F1_2 domain-containing protein n=1 Tax=Angiostrongylus cantonensis TaxID=6313 RepID=A0A0K0DKT9_ANGCA
MVVCVITAPATGLVYDVFINSIMVFNILIIACYILLIYFLKGNTSMKQIHRSLIVISSTVVFGWFSTMLIVVIASFLHVEIERIYVNLLAGLFVNSACATNFFVYYLNWIKCLYELSRSISLTEDC